MWFLLELFGGLVEYFFVFEGGVGYYICFFELEMLVFDFVDEEMILIEDLDLLKLMLLFVEDNVLVVEVIILCLEKFIGKVVYVENGCIVFDMVLKVKLDLIIIDLFMFEMVGDELICILRCEGFINLIIGLIVVVVGDDM